MSPDHPELPGAGRTTVRWFLLASVLFAAWAVGLGIMAFTSAEKPRVVEVGPPRP